MLNNLRLHIDIKELLLLSDPLAIGSSRQINSSEHGQTICNSRHEIETLIGSLSHVPITT